MADRIRTRPRSQHGGGGNRGRVEGDFANEGLGEDGVAEDDGDADAQVLEEDEGCHCDGDEGGGDGVLDCYYGLCKKTC